MKDDQFEDLIAFVSSVDVVDELEELLFGDSDTLGVLLDGVDEVEDVRVFFSDLFFSFLGVFDFGMVSRLLESISDIIDLIH